MKRLILSFAAAGALALGMAALTDGPAGAGPVPEAVAESAPAAVPEAVPQAAIPNGVFVPAWTADKGPVHTHTSGCDFANCFRWILQNGTVRQGPYANMVGETPLMLVLCSYRFGTVAQWNMDPGPYGPFGNRGTTHPFCQSPNYDNIYGFGTNNGPWQWARLRG